MRKSMPHVALPQHISPLDIAVQSSLIFDLHRSAAAGSYTYSLHRSVARRGFLEFQYLYLSNVTARFLDPSRRYYFFEGLSFSGALLLLAQFGPGEIAVEEDEVLLGDVQRARD